MNSSKKFLLITYFNCYYVTSRLAKIKENTFILNIGLIIIYGFVKIFKGIV